MIEYKRYKISELNDFLNSSLFEKSAILPISKHRAISYINNPRADENDTVMYLALENEKIVAYKLMLPDKIFINGVAHKMAWFSCTYVSNLMRGKGIGKKMNEMTWNDWQGKIFYHHPAKESSNMYLSSGRFRIVNQPLGIRCFYRVNLVNYWKSRRKTKYLIPFIYLIQFGANAIISLWRSFKPKFHEPSEFECDLVNEIDDELNNFIQSYVFKGPMNRSIDEIQWMRDYPWIIQSVENLIKDRYYFSAYEPEFKTYWLRLKRAGNIEGFVIYSVKNGNLKVLYSYCNPEAVTTAGKFIMRQMVINNWETMTVYDPEVVEMVLKSKHPFWLIRKKSRPLFASNKLCELLINENPVFHAGDGDNAFT